MVQGSVLLGFMIRRATFGKSTRSIVTTGTGETADREVTATNSEQRKHRRGRVFMGWMVAADVAAARVSRTYYRRAGGRTGDSRAFFCFLPGKPSRCRDACRTASLCARSKRLLNGPLLHLNLPAQSLLDRYERPLLAFARHRAGDSETARDAVQDTFLRYFRDRPSGDLESLAPWLFTVCRRVIIDHQRKQQRIVPMNPTLTFDQTIDDAAASPAVALEEKDDAHRLKGLIKSLPDRQQELVRLKFEAGLSYRDIAAATGLTVSNVGTLLHHAVQSLREQFHASVLA
jgi:RNA polymerase sigma-70 factor (ECF subfamily)